MPLLRALAAILLLASTAAVAGPERDAVERGSALVQQVGERASELVFTALDFLGVPYRRGGQSQAEGFDCSGFTRYVFEAGLGLALPRRSAEQARAPELAPVGRDELQPGDLVFFDTLKRHFSHVGIYIGEGRFVHAPRPGQNVRVEDLANPYWSRRFDGARRAAALAAGP